MTSSIFQSLMLPLGMSGPGLDAALLDARQSMLLSKSPSEERRSSIAPQADVWGFSGSVRVGSSGVTLSSLIFVSCGLGVSAGSVAAVAVAVGSAFVAGVTGSDAEKSLLRLGTGESVPRDVTSTALFALLGIA